jgi:predicted secreted hydrolase
MAPLPRRTVLALSVARWLAVGSATTLATPSLSASPGQPPAPDDDAVAPGRRLRFPRDHGAHPGATIEWWYATGWLQDRDGQPRLGFQVTFFRSRTPLADAPAAQADGRFAPRQLLFAHAALTDLGARRHRHAQRISRWSGDESLPDAHAGSADTRLALGAWRLQRSPSPTGGSRYASQISAPEAGFALALSLTSSQPLLLQGQAGFSQKGPRPAQASHYYSQPQLAVQADLVLDGRRQAWTGSGWL